MPAPKPSIGQLLIASGYNKFESSLVSRAINTLYGNVGANLDERNWDAILSSADPLSAAESALREQWQDSSYLLRNAHYILGIGYFDISPEVTYRQMGQRLGFTYNPAWSKGSTFESISTLSDATLNSMAQAYSAAYATPSITFNTTINAASMVFSHQGNLTWSVSGSASAVAAGSMTLIPAGVGGEVHEGLVTLTRPSGAASTNSLYVLVGTDTAMTRNFNAPGTPLNNRLVVLGGGNDNVRTGAGTDTVYGGGGDDTIKGNAGDDLLYGGNGNDDLEGGQGDDTLDGGADNDFVWGGTTGADRLTGGAGADQFRFIVSNTGVTINDFSLTDNDLLSFLDGDVDLSAVNFAAITNGSTLTANLLAADFDAVASIALVRSDTGGANAGNNQVYVITTVQTTADIQAAVPGGALNAYVTVYDSTQARAKVYYDADWSNTTERIEVATIIGLSSTDVAGLRASNFNVWFA